MNELVFKPIKNNECEVKPKRKKDIFGLLVIPESYDGMLVTTIAKDAFHDCKELTGILFPNTLTTIKAWAFCNTKISELVTRYY